MRFNGLDLNLLVALDALLKERSISRAAERLFLSQPAMSNSLARLRDYFNDPLLESSGRRMTLTPRGESLVGPVREVLMRIESTVAAQPTFNPATESRLFTLLVSDFTTTVLIPALVERVYREAPHIRLELKAQQENPASLIDRGDTDLLIVPSQYISEEHPSQPIFEEQYVCVTWEGNTRIRDQLTFDDYMSVGHIAGQYSGSRMPAFDSWFLERFDVKRRVEVTASTLAVLHRMVIGTDRIATVHRRLVERDIGSLPIRVWQPPMQIPKLIQMMQWHKHRTNDLALTWLRECIAEVGRMI
ncbi:DNA-binding transcriptional regulator, LysR family [Collimonas sp. OK607]|uniref:LysR family transcriptional regulator n=1 Tax=Collimonas sp. OK607 TaxID=1798194 RepID=UPI0008EEFF2A|nr:LysR family transcriptional regulator [Collimonas sp. OK607]SFB27695.1 DNA-binding transcriptional regulator, LysR family [Collimonas sp. OK607]